MSSEEMRFELEAFVNTGLREGWSGWPLKRESRMGRTSGLPLYAEPGTIESRWDDRLPPYGGWLEVFKVGCRYCLEN